MTSAPAESEPPEMAWEEAVFSRRAVSRRHSEMERTAADEVMRYFASHNSGEPEKRAWATALRKPVEAALEDLRHHPKRAANLLAPVVEDALRTARHRRYERWVEAVGRVCLCLTRPRMWMWTLKALWEGDAVWSHIQEKAQWHEVPELILFDNRSGAVLGRAESHSSQRLPGEPSLDEMHGGRRAAQAEEEGTRVPDEDGLRGMMTSKVVVVVGWRCKLVARVRGQAPANLRSTLQALCEEAQALLDRPPPRGATHEEALDRLLESGLVNQVASSRPRGWVLALGGGALACLLVIVAVKEYRWQRLLAVLEREPGLKVLDRDTTWGRREVSGLRDPLARAPEDLARAMGLSPGEVVMRFKTYLSADEPLASRRVLSAVSASGMPVKLHKQEPPPARP